MRSRCINCVWTIETSHYHCPGTTQVRSAMSHCLSQVQDSLFLPSASGRSCSFSSNLILMARATSTVELHIIFLWHTNRLLRLRFDILFFLYIVRDWIPPCHDSSLTYCVIKPSQPRIAEPYQVIKTVTYEVIALQQCNSTDPVFSVCYPRRALCMPVQYLHTLQKVAFKSCDNAPVSPNFYRCCHLTPLHQI